MLLSDEQLKQFEGSQEADKILDKLRANPKELQSTKAIMEMIFLGMREAAKAQVLHIVEWGSESCWKLQSEHSPTVDYPEVSLKRECDECWEELKRASE